MSEILRVAIFDDVLAARREVFHIPGLDVGVYGDADDVCLICTGQGAPDVVCMDYAMGPQHANGADAIRAVRTIGFSGKIVAMSSDPAANLAMIAAGANESLLQKSMLRSYLVALGAGTLPDSQSGKVGLPLLCLLGALTAMVTGVLLVGPLGHAPRYHGDLVKLAARVLPQGSPPSAVDGTPSPAEAVAVWAARAQAFEVVAGDERLKGARFDVATGGERWSIDASRATRWHLAEGPSRRLGSPADVAQGAGLPGFPGVRYVARSQRIVEGQHLWIVGLRRPDAGLAASEIADEAHRSLLGAEMVAQPVHQGGGLALLGLSALLLAGAARS